MGNFRLEVNALGGHGCARTTSKRPGEEGRYYGCNSMYCPDCQFREFVRALKRTGTVVNSATETHWPGEPSEVVDDVLNEKRIKGAF